MPVKPAMPNEGESQDPAERATSRAAEADRPGPAHPVRGLYAITPEEADTTRLTDRVSRAIEGGIDVLQYRTKLPDPTLRRTQAAALKALCDRAGIPFIVNDDVSLAIDVDASGVHIGREDGDPGEVRARLGPARLLGVSCYDNLPRALALRGVADHIAFGSVFASSTKPGAVRAPLSLFGEARREGLRTVAIGGIQAGNAHLVLEAGADAIAVISDVFGGNDPRAAAQRLAAIVREATAGC